eukprot:2869337-Alexandrium_andersonii.AAC.1
MKKIVPRPVCEYIARAHIFVHGVTRGSVRSVLQVSVCTESFLRWHGVWLFLGVASHTARTRFGMRRTWHWC